MNSKKLTEDDLGIRFRWHFGRRCKVQQDQKVCCSVRDVFRWSFVADTTFRSAKGRGERLSLFQGVQKEPTRVAKTRAPKRGAPTVGWAG